MLQPPRFSLTKHEIDGGATKEECDRLEEKSLETPKAMTEESLSTLRSNVEKEEVRLSETLESIKKILDTMDVQFHAGAEVDAIVKRVIEKTSSILKKKSLSNKQGREHFSCSAKVKEGFATPVKAQSKNEKNLLNSPKITQAQTPRKRNTENTVYSKKFLELMTPERVLKRPKVERSADEFPGRILITKKEK